jgi:hypothetical protein
MSEGGAGAGEGDASAILIPLHEARRERLGMPVDRAIFSVYRRASEVPLFQIVKDPKLARRQGAFSVVAAGGRILKRGHELARVLNIFDNRLKLVKA